MLMFSAYYVVIGEMTIGYFTLVNAFMFQLFQPLTFIGFDYRDIQAYIANIERMLELVDEEPSVKDEVTDHFFFNDTATTEIYTLSLHDALPISPAHD